MASTAEPTSPDAPTKDDRDLPLWRLYVIRILALFFVVPGFFLTLPGIIDPDISRRGMLDSMLDGLWVTVLLFGIRYPQKVMPILLFEFIWKTLWLINYGLPKWYAGPMTPQLAKDLYEIGAFSIVIGLIIPWPYVWRHYFLAPADRWR